MNFSTFGPFKLGVTQADDDLNAVDRFYADMNSAHPDLEKKGIGVYIVAQRQLNGTLLPWYVGRTTNHFGARLFQHIEGGKFDNLLTRHQALEFLLIALVTRNGKIAPRSPSLNSKAIFELEFSLIRDCLLANPALVNKQERTFHSRMHVPGYRNSAVENYDDAARELSAMLNRTAK